MFKKFHVGRVLTTGIWMFRYTMQNLQRHFLMEVPVAATAVYSVGCVAHLFSL